MVDSLPELLLHLYQHYSLASVMLSIGSRSVLLANTIVGAEAFAHPPVGYGGMETVRRRCVFAFQTGVFAVGRYGGVAAERSI